MKGMAMIPDLAAVAAGGALGSVLRFVVTLAAQSRFGAGAIGTILVNVIGCLLIGALTEAAILGADVPQRLQLAIRVGVLGGLTTFSTFGYESVVFATKYSTLAMFGYVAANVLLGLAAVWLGIAGMRMLYGPG